MGRMVPRPSPEEMQMAYDRMDLATRPKEYILGNPPEPSAQAITTTPQYKFRYVTHTKHPLTFKEARFIDAYMACGDGVKAVEEAGYNVKKKSDKANKLLRTDYIADEIIYRQELYKTQQVADRQEILAFYTAVMRGEVRDQFNLEATLRDRLDAGEKLAKRIIDVEEKKNVQAQQVIVNIDFNRDNEEPDTVVDIQQVSD